jgi:hypothetical protein
MGVYIPSAPVEEKGYKRMINLPDWLNMQNIFIKFKNSGKNNGSARSKRALIL